MAAARRPTRPKDDREIGRGIIERAIRHRRRHHPDRAKNVAIGSAFFLLGIVVLGGAVVGLWSSRDKPGIWLAVSTSGLVFGTIALLGLSMLIQGVRNRPGIDGFFYRAAAQLGRHLSPLSATLLPLALCLVVAMQGVALGSTRTIAAAFGAGLAWLSIFVQLFVHELGHLVAVRRARLRFVRLVAGPLTLLPRGAGYRVGTNRQWRHLLVGAVYYEEAGRLSPRTTLFVAAGGPVATAFVGLLALAAKDACASEVASVAYSVASTNAAIAGGTLLLNLFPMRLGNLESDGLQILLALRSLARRG